MISSIFLGRSDPYALSKEAIVSFQPLEYSCSEKIEQRVSKSSLESTDLAFFANSDWDSPLSHIPSRKMQWFHKHIVSRHSSRSLRTVS